MTNDALFDRLLATETQQSRLGHNFYKTHPENTINSLEECLGSVGMSLQPLKTAEWSQIPNSSAFFQRIIGYPELMGPIRTELFVFTAS